MGCLHALVDTFSFQARPFYENRAIGCKNDAGRFSVEGHAAALPVEGALTRSLPITASACLTIICGERVFSLSLRIRENGTSTRLNSVVKMVWQARDLTFLRPASGQA